MWAGSSSGKGIWLRAGRPGFDPGCRKSGEFSSLLRVQNDPGVHSGSCKMSTGGLSPGVKAAERRTSHPTSSWLCICGPLHPHPPWAFMACNGDTFTVTIYIYHLFAVKSKVKHFEDN